MRAQMPLAIGRGLDRATGLAAVQPQFPVDVRNAYARDAKMALRPGMGGTGFGALPWGTHILDVAGVKATLELLFAVYDEDTREIRIYQCDTFTGVMHTLSSPVNGVWGTLVDGADFPVVKHAEADGKVFFAHAENDLAFRLPTIYYTPDPVTPSSAGTLTTLECDLDGDGVAAPVYFFGVYAYLEYLTGWGFGTEAIDGLDGANALRVSQPGAPTDFRPGNFYQAGVPKDLIIDCIAVDNVLAVRKTDEGYILVGTSPADFGIFLVDAQYGTQGPKLTINIGGNGGQAYTWANDGARQLTRGGSIPIAQPLELISPLPADFPVPGPPRLGFVAYDQERYLLEWCFPNIEEASVPVPGFMLSLWNPDDPRWTFSERQQLVTCAGVLISRDTGEPPSAPVGYVSDFTAEDA